MVKNKNPEQQLLCEYIQTFIDKLGNVDRIAQRIVREQTGDTLNFLYIVRPSVIIKSFGHIRLSASFLIKCVNLLLPW